MGTFSTPISIGSPDGRRWESLDALVDTGASIASVPASMLRGLGVEPMRTERFTFAQGETREMEIGQTWIRIGDREVVTLVLFNEEGTTPLLGAHALEGVFMGVDPVGKRLVPVGGWMARAAAWAESDAYPPARISRGDSQFHITARPPGASSDRNLASSG